MANCCPCGDPCAIAADEFDRTAVGSNWDERSGSWSISSNKLTTASASALIVYQAAEADSASMVVSALVELATDGDQVRGVVAYEDDNNYLFGELTRKNCTACSQDCSTLALYQVSGGTVTTLEAPVEIGLLDWSQAITFSVCYYADTYPAGEVGILSATANGKSVYKYDVTASGTYGGLGTGTNGGGALFDSFKLENSQRFSPVCGPCVTPCQQTSLLSNLDSTSFNECDWTATGSPTWSNVTGKGYLLQYSGAGCLEPIIKPLDDTMAKASATFYAPSGETVTLTLGAYELAVAFPATGSSATVTVDGVSVSITITPGGIHSLKFCADGDYLVATVDYSGITLFTRIITL